MSDKIKGFRRHNVQLYYRLITFAVMMLLLGSLAAVGWFAWTTMDDVLNHNDNSGSIKVQGVDTDSLEALEKVNQGRLQGATSLPPLQRDPFISKNDTEQVPVPVPVPEPMREGVAAPPATIATPEPRPVPEPAPILPLN